MFDFSVVRHQNGCDRGPDHSKVSGSEQESFETSVRSACQSLFFCFENSLVERQSAECKKGNSWEAMQSGNYGHLDCLGMWRRDIIATC